MSFPIAQNGDQNKSVSENMPAPANGHAGIPALAEALDAEAETIFASVSEIRHADVLGEILANLEQVNFRELAGLKKDEKLAQKHLSVLSIRQILETARRLQCGLCLNNGYIYAYNGQFWKVVDKQGFGRFLTDAAGRLGVDDITAEHHPFCDDLHKQFLKSAYLPRPERNESATLINLRNGTFEIDRQNIALREFRRTDFMTYQLPFDYDPQAECPRWRQFLNEVLPDESKQLILAEYIGYIFAPQLKLEKSLILFGDGQNGKSVVFDVINALLGRENVSNYTLEELSHEYYRAKIADKLLNYSSEISDHIEAQKFKTLTSGEPISAREPYQEVFTLYSYARLAFNTNKLPRDVEHTHGFFRRFLIVIFDVTIREDQKNTNLAKEIITEELSGIFNWVLRGLNRLLQQNDFSRSESVRAALDAYHRESDTVALFLEDEKYEKSQVFTAVKTVYAEYKNYCLENCYKPLGRNKFTKRLESNGVVVERTEVGLVAYIQQ